MVECGLCRPLMGRYPRRPGYRNHCFPPTSRMRIQASFISSLLVLNMNINLIPAVKVIRDSATVAEFRLVQHARQRTWILGAGSTAFFMVAPLVFLGETVIGKDGERLEPFFSLSGYSNYAGYLAVPLVLAVLTNTAYSWIGQAIREEQRRGTLERVLMSMRHPSAFILGGAVAHLTFLIFFVMVGIVSISLVADLALNINWSSVIVVSLLHLYAVYGFAFVLSSLFLWIRDANILQQSIAYFFIPILAGAGYPIAILPGWLQAISKCIPFTWSFELARQAALRHTPLDEMVQGLIAIFSISTVLWLLAAVSFRTMLERARRTGSLGLY